MMLIGLSMVKAHMAQKYLARYPRGSLAEVNYNSTQKSYHWSIQGVDVMSRHW